MHYEYVLWHARNITHTMTVGMANHQPFSHICVAMETFTFLQNYYIVAAVVACLEFIFSSPSSAEARIVVASEYFHEIVCTRRGFTLLANPNERFEMTEKKLHTTEVY